MAKYIQEFTTEAAYNTARENNYIEPWTSLTDSTGDLNYNWCPDINGKSYVDLGLPSGNLWATSNLTNYFYRWGELTGTTLTATIAPTTYRWGSELTKYNSTDGLTKLELEDDAANVLYGGDWCIPTISDWEELFENTTINNTGSLFVTLKSDINDNGIVLQKWGIKSYTATNSYGSGSGVYGYYWCSDLDSSDNSNAILAVVSDNQTFIPPSGQKRYYGACIRPVIRRIW